MRHCLHDHEGSDHVDHIRRDRGALVVNGGRARRTALGERGVSDGRGDAEPVGHLGQQISPSGEASLGHCRYGPAAGILLVADHVGKAVTIQVHQIDPGAVGAGVLGQWIRECVGRGIRRLPAGCGPEANSRNLIALSTRAVAIPDQIDDPVAIHVEKRGPCPVARVPQFVGSDKPAGRGDPSGASIK